MFKWYILSSSVPCGIEFHGPLPGPVYPNINMAAQDCLSIATQIKEDRFLMSCVFDFLSACLCYWVLFRGEVLMLWKKILQKKHWLHPCLLTVKDADLKIDVTKMTSWPNFIPAPWEGKILWCITVVYKVPIIKDGKILPRTVFFRPLRRRCPNFLTRRSPVVYSSTFWSLCIIPQYPKA